MGKRIGFSVLALLFLLAVHLNLYCTVTVNGTAREGLYSPAAVRNCTALARETAEEILRGPVTMPEIRRSYRLSLRHREGDEQALTDLMLRSVPGLRLKDSVIVNGTQLGTVEDGARLMEKLRASIRDEMPGAAVFGNISGKVQIQRVYGRAGQTMPDEDMIRLITGMAPVVYVDAAGKVV